ncbi:MAG: sensor domain-containing diguanylate cyclase [Chloroflexi bacterium]|nr:sensor domain-containing diguanylate cyclase [Chloroflexota bacterium]
MPPTAEAVRDRRRYRARAVLLVLGAGLSIVLATMLVESGPQPLEMLQAAILVAIAVSVAVQRRTTARVGRRRQARERSFTRILQGLSRSVSPESIVAAIMDELRFTSGADHVVVARQTEPDGTMEVTLVTASPSVPASRTLLAPDILGHAKPEIPRPQSALSEGSPRSAPSSARFQDAADELARRVRAGYGLLYTLSEPLIADRRFVGALMLSKRTRDSWLEQDRRLLHWASQEVSAALARAYALEELETRANIDALTGLPNRRYLDELVSIIRPRRRAGDDLGILMIDIDRFKTLNDRYGHATGDVVLRAVAGAIHNTVRAEDTPARYGGEEFAVILRRASAKAAAEVAERVRLAVKTIPPDRLGLEHPVSVSVGVAVAGDGDQDVRTIIERADRAMYVAKRGGRDRVATA